MNLIVRCATFSKSLNPQNIDKSISDIRIRIRFPFESSFWISLSGCKPTILPDIQPANRIVIISYMWRNHIATWAQANNSGRNLDLNKMRVLHLHYICNIVFGLDLNLKNLNHFTGIWKRLKVTVWGPLPWSRYAILHSTTRRCLSIYCVLLTPQWQQSLKSPSVHVGDTWCLTCSTVRLDSQNRKFGQILIITEAKNAQFFVWKRTGFVHQDLNDFVKMTLTPVSSHWLWLESSRVILCKASLESSHHFCQRDSSRVRVTKNRDSSRVESLTRDTLSLHLSEL